MTKAFFTNGAGWTKERVELLKQLHATGMSFSQIADRLGATSRAAICGKVSRLRLTKRRASFIQATASLAGISRGRAPAVKRAPYQNAGLAFKTSRIFKGPGQGDGPALPPSSEPLTPTCQLTDLTSHMCRWPIGDPALSSFGFCGRLAEGTYCAAHRKRACQPSEHNPRKGVKELMRSVRRFL